MGTFQGTARPRQGSESRATTPLARPRIAFADADLVRERVQSAAAESQLAGARDAVLRAVLKLLCGWSRIKDDRIRIHQIIDQLEPGLAYDPKTVGRALAALQRGEFIVYTAARGRGRFAEIAIHARFLDGIEQLERGADGRVVTFSRRRPYISQRNHLPTLRTAQASGRPTEVPVDPDDVRRVLAEAPEHFRGLPRHLRWCLGREIRHHLGRGFTAEQLLAILSAPGPDRVDRPLRLAKWRFAHNLVGTGPRLAPLQRAWDAAHRDEERKRHTDDLTERLAAVHAATTAPMRHRMLDALRAKLGEPIVNEAAAVAHAARIACREHPGMPLASAISRWVDQRFPLPTYAEKTAETNTAAAAETETDGCVHCQASSAPIRDELPLRSAVCDHCWNYDATHHEDSIAA